MKKIFQFLKYYFVTISTIYFYSVKKLAIGTHLFYFLKYQTNNNFVIIFDVGSNIGQTISQIKKYFPKSTIYAFEPFLETFKKLKLNTEKYTNIHYNNFAFGDKQEEVLVDIITETSVSNSLLNKNNGNKDSIKQIVNSITLDTFLSNNPNITAIDLLKIDTEGYDKKVLEGGNKNLRNGKVKFILTEVGLSKQNTKHVNISTMISYLEDLDFIFLGIYGLDIRHVFWGGHFGNALFIHKNYLGLLNNIVK